VKLQEGKDNSGAEIRMVEDSTIYYVIGQGFN
jgi:hypothetical protein